MKLNHRENDKQYRKNALGIFEDGLFQAGKIPAEQQYTKYGQDIVHEVVVVQYFRQFDMFLCFPGQISQ